jgi:hypothetical protein
MEPPKRSALAGGSSEADPTPWDTGQTQAMIDSIGPEGPARGRDASIVLRSRGVAYAQ